MELRPYQRDALDAITQDFASGLSRLLVSLPTGAGKTIVFSHLIQSEVERGRRVLVLAHRDELIEQARSKLCAVAPQLETKVGIVKGPLDEWAEPVVCASVQTLARRRRLERIPRDHYDLVIVDEAHHAPAPSYLRILEWLQVPLETFQDYPFDPAQQTSRLLGVTATPRREEKGTKLSEVFERLSYHLQIKDLINQGWLVHLRGRRVVLEDADLGSLHLRGGDFQPGEIASQLTRGEGLAFIARQLKEHAGDRRTIAFLPTVETARVLSRHLAEQGFRSALVHGGTPAEERRSILERLAQGAIDVLCNCMVLTEGFDEPGVDCILIARPTRSRVLYAQMIGRGLRLHPGKTSCLVLDCVGASTRHDLLRLEDFFGEDMPKVRDPDDDDPPAELPMEGEGSWAPNRKLRDELEEFDFFERAKDPGYWQPITWSRETVSEVSVRRRGKLIVFEGLSRLGISAKDFGLWVGVLTGGEWQMWWVRNRQQGWGREGLFCCALKGRGEALSWLITRARSEGSLWLSLQSAAWRQKSASEGQVKMLRRRGILGDNGQITKGEAGNLLTAQELSKLVFPKQNAGRADGETSAASVIEGEDP